MKDFLPKVKTPLRLPGVTLFALFCALQSLAQTGATRIYTDYNGYWTSSSTAINPVKPDNSHNLLGFTWNNTTYSTGVNDALLTAKGVTYTAKKYQAFPVKNIPLPGTNSNFVALGQLYDGVDNGASNPPPFDLPTTISRFLTDGANGLGLGSGITNIPSTSDALTFTFSAITDPGQIGDGVPDILISQIAQPDNVYDQVYFQDANGNLVGNIVNINQNSASVPSVGNWTADFYNPNTGTIPSGFVKSDRGIRLWAADASVFGLTAANYKNAVVLRYKLAGSSDPAFLAFNTDFIQLVSVNDDAVTTDVNTPITIDVLANDEPRSGLVPSSVAVTANPAHGSVSINPTTGAITYTPAAGFSGTDRFTYQACNAANQCDDAVVTVTIGNADLAISKKVDVTNPPKGSNVVFTITAVNNGPNDATGVVVQDPLPAGYTFVSASTNQYSSNTGNWTIGTLANKNQATLTITATVNETGPYDNTATISGSKIDLVSSNNTASASTTPISVSDRSITKTASSNTPNIGSVVSFTVTATNIGPSASTGVRVTDLLPSGYSFSSATTSVGSYASGSGVWTLGNLSKSATATLVISATVNASGSYTNTATVTGNETDPVDNNNTASVTLNPQPLPVTLISFKASVEGTTVKLDWTTVAEQNNAGFSVERSPNARLFSTLGFQTAGQESGNSTERLAYRFIDGQPLPGVNYYRLAQTDKDGTITYSKIVSAHPLPTEVTLYPNPARHYVFLKNGLPGAVIDVLTSGGQVVATTFGTQVDVSKLPTGLYFIRLTAGGRTQILKFVKE